MICGPTGSVDEQYYLVARYLNWDTHTEFCQCEEGFETKDLWKRERERIKEAKVKYKGNREKASNTI